MPTLGLNPLAHPIVRVACAFLRPGYVHVEAQSRTLPDFLHEAVVEGIERLWVPGRGNSELTGKVLRVYLCVRRAFSIGWETIDFK